MRVLDYGAGTGLVSFALSEHVGHVTAMDSSRGMLEVIDSKMAESRVANVTTELRDLLADGIPAERYDCIVSSMTLHHVADTAGLLAAMRSMLVSGGRIALADLEEEDGLFHHDNAGVEHYGFDRQSLAKLAAGAGFADVNCDIVHTVTRPDRNGVMRSYGVFLLAGIKA
jgi:2-polyprenyl-3-methyl-5-hydroxy-6-metoxy-1,4-benzoquinol methylase